MDICIDRFNHVAGAISATLKVLGRADVRLSASADQVSLIANTVFSLVFEIWATARLAISVYGAGTFFITYISRFSH